MNKRVEFTVENQKIAGSLHSPEGFKKPYPCVIISHGYKSHRNSKKYLQISYRFPYLNQMLESYWAAKKAGLKNIKRENLGQFVKTDSDYETLLKLAKEAI